MPFLKEYCVGDYISQIRRVVRSCKERPNTTQIYRKQNNLGINAVKYMVNNVLFRNVKYVDIQDTYIGLVCDLDINTVQRLCDVLNHIGEVKATYCDLGHGIVMKFVPIKFLQLNKVTYNKGGTDLKNEIYRIQMG